MHDGTSLAGHSKGGQLLKQDQSPIMVFLLGAVVMSSLALLVFGLNPEPGPIEILQLPTTVAQIVFIFAVVMKVGIQNVVAPLTRIQRILIGTLVIYVLFVSFKSTVPSSLIFAPSWIVHILFFVALLSFFSNADDTGAGTIWMVVGLTALIHVCVFLFAWAIWPDAIRQGNLPAFDNIRHLGYFLAPAAAVTAVQYVTRMEKPLFPLLCFGAAVFYIIYTGSRGGAVALVGGLAMTGVFMVWRRQNISIARAVVLMVITVFAVVISELLPSLPWKPVFGRGVDAISQTGTEMLGGRSQVWSASLVAIEQNWLLGNGPAIMGQIPEYLGPSLRHPHNIGLQLLLHWGALGSVITLGAILSFAPEFWTAPSQQPRLSLMPLTILGAMGTHSLVDGSLFYPFSTVIAIIAFANVVCISRQQ